MKIVKGQAVPPHRSQIRQFPKSIPAPALVEGRSPEPPSPAPASAPAKTPSPLPSETKDLAQEATPPPAFPSPIPANPPAAEPEAKKVEKSDLKPPSPPASIPLGRQIVHGKNKRRLVRCFDCRHEHEVSLRSSSALCPKCGLYISLRDFDIKDTWNKSIQTRGNVTIHKQGLVQGTTIQCDNLVVDGSFSGGVECSGDFTIRRHGKLMGEVTCRRLIIEKRAEVEFLNEVTAREVVIDGTVKGNIRCQGKLSLLKKATLKGDISVGSLTVAEGAKHHGQIRMTGIS
ncbi:MAG: polymer-forming cytoskeletal protein [Verrucomicrobiales bacterium]